jgi:hypothetical protein
LYNTICNNIQLYSNKNQNSNTKNPATKFALLNYIVCAPSSTTNQSSKLKITTCPVRTVLHAFSSQKLQEQAKDNHRPEKANLHKRWLEIRVCEACKHLLMWGVRRTGAIPDSAHNGLCINLFRKYTCFREFFPVFRSNKRQVICRSDFWTKIIWSRIMVRRRWAIEWN